METDLENKIEQEKKNKGIYGLSEKDLDFVKKAARYNA